MEQEKLHYCVYSLDYTNQMKEKYLYLVSMQCCLRMIIYMRIKQVWRT